MNEIDEKIKDACRKRERIDEELETLKKMKVEAEEKKRIADQEADHQWLLQKYPGPLGPLLVMNAMNRIHGTKYKTGYDELHTLLINGEGEVEGAQFKVVSVKDGKRIYGKSLECDKESGSMGGCYHGGPCYFAPAYTVPVTTESIIDWNWYKSFEVSGNELKITLPWVWTSHSDEGQDPWIATIHRVKY
jgi:hypothetical protein